MDFLHDVLVWLNDPANWEGERGILHRLAEHLQMSTVAIVAAMVLALPPAVLLGHRRRFGGLAVNVSNVGRAIPSFAILVIGVREFGLLELPIIGSFTTFLALTALAAPPIVTNTYVAMTEVPADVREAARGMGMAERDLLLRVELPLALPLMMAGIRTAAVQVVATATIAAVVGAGGLGRFIVDGRAVRDDVRLFAGALLVAALSLLTEVALAVLQRSVTPRGLRRGARRPTVDPIAAKVPGAIVELEAAA